MIDLNAQMPVLTRRADPDRANCWRVCYGDVHVGTIAKCVGNPGARESWQWRCGFYPGRPRRDRQGVAASFDQARAAFDAAWQDYLPKRTEVDFQAWRDQQAWTAQKYAMRERGDKLPSQRPNSMMRCRCGDVFDSHRLEHTLIHVPHLTASHREIRR